MIWINYLVYFRYVLISVWNKLKDDIDNAFTVLKWLTCYVNPVFRHAQHNVQIGTQSYFIVNVDSLNNKILPNYYYLHTQWNNPYHYYSTFLLSMVDWQVFFWSEVHIVQLKSANELTSDLLWGRMAKSINWGIFSFNESNNCCIFKIIVSMK